MHSALRTCESKSLRPRKAWSLDVIKMYSFLKARLAARLRGTALLGVENRHLASQVAAESRKCLVTPIPLSLAKAV